MKRKCGVLLAMMVVLALCSGAGAGVVFTFDQNVYDVPIGGTTGPVPVYLTFSSPDLGILTSHGGLGTSDLFFSGAGGGATVAGYTAASPWTLDVLIDWPPLEFFQHAASGALPDGSGRVLLGSFTFNGDSVVSDTVFQASFPTPPQGQDYVVSDDGLISFEAIDFGEVTIHTFDTSVPLPSSALMGGLALAGLAAVRAMKKR